MTSSSRAPVSWDEYVREVGVNLARARFEANLSQEALAHRAGITRTHYQQLERGMWGKDMPANPSLKVLVRLSQALRVTLESLLPAGTTVHWPEEE